MNGKRKVDISPFVFQIYMHVAFPLNPIDITKERFNA